MKKLIRQWLGIDYDLRALHALQDELGTDLNDCLVSGHRSPLPPGIGLRMSHDIVHTRIRTARHP